MTDPEPRRGARILVVDEFDQLLLIRGFDPTLDEAPWWFTPGGGVDEGETHLQGAYRELWEETGLRDVELQGPVWYRSIDFTFMNRRFLQDEVFYFVRVPHFEPVTDGWTDLERETMLTFKWWTLDELLNPPELVYPLALGDELKRLLTHGLPDEPYDIGGDHPRDNH